MLLSVKEARELVLAEARGFGMEDTDLSDISGRVLATAISADRNYPPFNRSAVDGFAISAADLETHASFRIIEEVHAGAVAEKVLTPGTAIRIMTGAPVPESADAVVKVEDTIISNGFVQFTVRDVKRWANIAREGEDVKRGMVVLPENTLCTPPVLAILASLGTNRTSVHRLPVVSIISTGNELKDPGAEVLPYQIRDCNFFSLQGFFKSYGINPLRTGIVPDTKALLKEAVTGALSSDILIISGGVSMGEADFVPGVLEECGVRKVFHKTAIRPGKPVWFGRVGNTAVFALPGNPFSCQVAFKVFIESYIRKCWGMPEVPVPELPLGILKKKKTSFDEYFPCRIEGSSLMPVSFNGSGDLFSIRHAQGIALHAADKEALKEGDTVPFYFWDNRI